MDFDDPHVREVFFRVYGALPRQGPGCRESSARALEMAEGLPSGARVLDVGCGVGKQTLDLAKLLPEASFTAVDNHAPFLDTLKGNAAAKGLAGRVGTLCADMRKLPFEVGYFDLLWREGAAYLMGFENALLEWKRFIRTGGYLAVSEAVWLRDDVPEELLICWAEEYPDMNDVASRRELIGRCGYELVGDFVLPESAWWDDFYTPMQERIGQLWVEYGDDRAAGQVLDEVREEIEMYRTFSRYYGYAFFVMK